ncbi:EAL domain-containing protein [Sandaracinobacter sp. RS1-74]|uniref:putative bifunctional diguanylate cyclase/phosphodiesterase n=1 Tax=Sandaracinobacteroides sayramensis TaxID=2913411 RepID=UPI001EDC55FD|nr:GGDEF and EAL domain-containing protein [Sandaracinobacteroides sayramensis]MCG2842529.1 EAL domain-containing protein [Sandaracinobacteroides sayramensis]
MSMMFKPPDQSVRLQAVDLIGVGPEGDPFWQRVRRAQLSFFDRYLPFNIAIAVVNGALLLGIFGGRLPGFALVWLVVAHALALALGSGRRRARRLQRAAPVGRAAVFRSLLNLALVGSSWALVFHQALGQAAPGEAILVVAMAMAGMGCMSFSTIVWPLGSIAMWGLVAIATMAGLFRHHGAEAWPVTVVMLSFILFMARGTLVTTQGTLVRIRLKERVREQEEVVRLLLNEFEANGSEWLFEFDPGGRLTFASSRFAEALRRPVDEVVGQHWSRFLSDRDSARELFEAVRRGHPFRDILLRVEVEGEVRWWSLSGTPKFDRDGCPTGYRGVGSDVTDRQRAAERIAELATFDSLTGLVNRRIVHQALADALAVGPAAEGQGVALLFVDLDRFKAVNDSLGHGAGDRLLAEVGARLREQVALGAGPRALVGRLGGDEFAVLLRSASLQDAVALGETLIERLSQPYQIAGKPAVIGASIGLAIGPEDGSTVEALMRAADLALYDVKAKGRGSVRAYNRAIHKRAEDRHSLELDLRHALSGGQFRLAFQPVVDALDERVVGFEALLRWRHPQQGEISPALFIPIAEDSGQIARIGAWVLNEACRVASAWPRNVRVAVNISPLQFDDPGLVEMVRATLRRWNIAPERLELELTESLFLDERAQTAAMLAELQEMGVGFALDDFGTGYSSLGYLQKIAFRRIKIDRSFVRASATDGGESTAIIQAIVALAERLGMETTAEGAETRAEFEAMRRLGCAHVQGFYFGKPMPAEDAARLLDRARPLLELVEPLDPFSPRTLPPSSTAANGRSPAAAAPSTPPLLEAPRAPPPG